MNINVFALIKLMFCMILDSIIISLVMNLMLKIPITFQQSIGAVFILYGIFPIFLSEES
jgi:hypothetical protein